jgi:hypothetical protein
MSKQFHFHFLPTTVASQIPEYLLIECLYSLERTSRATRQLISTNEYLKHNFRIGHNYRNPQAKGVYSVHHGWKIITFVFGSNPDPATVSPPWKGPPKKDDKADRRGEL